MSGCSEYVLNMQTVGRRLLAVGRGLRIYAPPARFCHLQQVHLCRSQLMAVPTINTYLIKLTYGKILQSSRIVTKQLGTSQIFWTEREIKWLIRIKNFAEIAVTERPSSYRFKPQNANNKLDTVNRSFYLDVLELTYISTAPCLLSLRPEYPSLTIGRHPAALWCNRDRGLVISSNKQASHYSNTARAECNKVHFTWWLHTAHELSVRLKSEGNYSMFRLTTGMFTTLRCSAYDW